MSIKITNRSDVLQGIKQVVILETLKIILPHVQESVNKPIIDRFLSDFGNHPVIQSIQGYFEGDESRDLQAQVGLTGGEAAVALIEIGQAVRNSLRIKLSRQDDAGRFAKSGTLKLTIYTEELELNIRGISNATYEYHSKKYNNTLSIPWLKWILDGSHGEVDASITFEINDIKGLGSRSGRAVMVSNDEGWTLEKDILCDHKGMNFIEDVLASKTLINDLEEICKLAIENAIKDYV